MTSSYGLYVDFDSMPTPSNVFRDRLRTIHLDVPSVERLVREFQRYN